MTHPAPNVVLLIADQWRGDCLGCAGHPVVETPNLDNLFRHGTMFTRAYSAVPSCIAARAALLTGLSQKSHGRVGYKDEVRWNYPVTLPGLLANAGYHTHCVGKMHVSPPRHLMGFHSVELHDYLSHSRHGGKDRTWDDDYLQWLKQNLGQDADPSDTGLGSNGYSVIPWPYEERFHPTNWTTTRAIDFLRRRDPTKPFFLKTSYHRPHPPLDPPSRYLERYASKTLPPVNVADWAKANSYPDRGPTCPVPPSPEQTQLARKAYYAHLTHIDSQINRLVQALMENQVWDNTLLMFVSDHGETLFEHNLVGKAMPYNASTRIPFMIRLPDRWNVTQERASDALVELRDVLPTFLDASGVPIPQSIEGSSVLPLCRGERTSWRARLHGEHASPSKERAVQWIISDKELYVWFTRTGEEQYFRLDSDAGELQDLSMDDPGRVATLRQQLIDELEGREEGYVENNKLVVGVNYAPVLTRAGQGD